jgi:rfaE bifunctional protein kinase chain/domain/rfaE bifunctional protein nucleotidyltransferase chain/domain
MSSGNGASKLLPIRALAGVLARERAKKRKVVHCHGVFDLLHIGHIRYFEHARKLGDVLVVTVTPDRFVNKGPGRPAFPETLRAEAIAALQGVDYVAINEWPTAVETLKLLKPDFYVKGPDYKDASKDRTGGISKEEAAVKAAGGKLVITDDITFSASSLINKHLPTLPERTQEWLRAFSDRHPTDGVLAWLDKARPKKVLVVGEAILDEYVYTTAIGKSSKEPMLVVQRERNEQFAGGVLAVANHLSRFCGEVSVATFLGDRDSHEGFIRKSLHENVRPHFFYKTDSPTILKLRYIERYFFTKLLALYDMNDRPLEGADNKRFCDFLKKKAPEFDAVLVVDYGHGVMTDEAIDAVCSKAKFLAVNTQSNAGNLGYHTVSRYKRADYVCMAENEFRLEARDRHKDVREIASDVSKKLGASRVVVTRGNKGCYAYGRKEGAFEVPAVAGQVVDRMGAGDAFLAVTTPCALVGAPMEALALIGNAASAQAVATVGNRSSVDRVGLVKHIETLLK